MTKELQESYENTKVCFVSKEKFEKKKYLKDKKYRKVRYHCHYTWKCRGAGHSINNLTHSMPKKNPIVFHNGSNYNYHFIIKEVAEELKKEFTSSGESTEK